MKAFNRPRRAVGQGTERMEHYLRASFRPVAPRPDFVNELKSRLALESRRFRTRTTPLQYVLLSLAAAVTSALVILAGVRAVITLLGVLGILHQMRRQPAEQGAPLLPV